MPVAILAGDATRRTFRCGRRLAAAPARRAWSSAPCQVPAAPVALPAWRRGTRSLARLATQAEDSTAQPRPGGHGDDLAAHDGHARDGAALEQLERREAARRQRGEGCSRVQRCGDAARAVVGRGEVDLGAARAHQRGRGEQRADAAAARDLQADGVGDARRERARDRRGLVDRDPNRDALAQLAPGDAVDRLLGELEAEGGERGEWPRPPRRRPGAVGVEAQRARPGPIGGADRGDALDVVARPDLDLDARKPSATARRGSRGARRRRGGHARVDGDRRRRRVAEQLADRTAGTLAGEVPQREVDRRERLGQGSPGGRRQSVPPGAAGSAAASTGR